jgi:hypothetical protein
MLATRAFSKTRASPDMVKPMLDEDLHLITRLVQEVGWLDTARFGSVTSSHSLLAGWLAGRRVG